MALAYPDRIAKARGRPGEYVMANGRGATLEPHERLAREPFLAIAEIAGGAASARILAAAPLSLQEIEVALAPDIRQTDEVAFDRVARALRARTVRRYGALVPPPAAPAGSGEARPRPGSWRRASASIGLDILPWSKALVQWRERVMFLRRAEGDEWPDLSDEVLAGLRHGLARAASRRQVRPRRHRTPTLSTRPCAGSCPGTCKRRLDAEAPTHVEVPTGSRSPSITGTASRSLPVRVQELFGLDRHPTLAAGRAPLVLHLLSPAQRPIQITRDLPGFPRGFLGSRARGHARPVSPSPLAGGSPAAPPTRRAKPRGT